MKGIVTNISIIIPVYNSENQIEKCLDSIFSQDFSGVFEVIAVDDGSCDKSIEILKKYQENDPRLKIIEHGINRKLSVARATGMKAATGDYIMHVDSDDWLMPGVLDNLHKKCILTNADVVVFNYIKETRKGKRTFVHSIKNELFTKDKLKVQSFFYGAVWNKIVKKELIEKMVYGEYGYNSTEDLIYCSEILLKAHTFLLLPKYLYVYFKNTQSISSSYTPSKYLSDQIVIIKTIELLFDKYCPQEEIINNILNYFEKWIFLFIAKINFLFKSDFAKSKTYISNIYRSSLLTQNRFDKIIVCMNNRFESLCIVARLFGLRTSIWILYMNFRKKLLKNNFE